MNRSKLQICTEMLCNLASNGPMNLSSISERFEIEESNLQKYLKLLQDSSLVTKEKFGHNKIFFTITGSGLAVLNMFRPLIAEKYKIQKFNFKTTIPV